MKINTTEEQKKYKENQERLKREIERIKSLNLTSRGSKRYIQILEEDLNLSFEQWKIRENAIDNIRGINLK